MYIDTIFLRNLCFSYIVNTSIHSNFHLPTVFLLTILMLFEHLMCSSWKKNLWESERIMKSTDIFLFYVYNDFCHIWTRLSFLQKTCRRWYCFIFFSFRTWKFYSYPRQSIFTYSLSWVPTFYIAQRFLCPVHPKSKQETTAHLAAKSHSQSLSAFKFPFWIFYSLLCP